MSLSVLNSFITDHIISAECSNNLHAEKLLRSLFCKLFSGFVISLCSFRLVFPFNQCPQDFYSSSVLSYLPECHKVLGQEVVVVSRVNIYLNMLTDALELAR